MTQEEKQLLLKDLCARLPYKVKVKYYSMDYPYGSEPVILTPYLLYDRWENIREVEPYLRPMSSMTEKEKQYVLDIWSEDDLNNGIDLMYDNYMMLGYASDFIDWLNEHHFDYRELIEKDLALEAPEGMYKTE